MRFAIIRSHQVGGGQVSAVNLGLRIVTMLCAVLWQCGSGQTSETLAKVPEPVFSSPYIDRGALILPSGSLLAPDSSGVWRLHEGNGLVRRWPGLPARNGATACGRLRPGDAEEVLFLTSGNRVERYSVTGVGLGSIALPIHDAAAIMLLPADGDSETTLLAHSTQALCMVDLASRTIFEWRAQGDDKIQGVAWSDTREGRLIAIAAGKSIHLVDELGFDRSGWPVISLQSMVSAPLFPIAGKQIVVCADRLGRVHVWNMSGVMSSGWPFDTSTWNERVFLAAADWDGDGQDEIFVGAAEGYWALDIDGNLVPGTPVYSRSANIVPPLLVDIDGDASPELIGGTLGHGAFALRKNGEAVDPGWGEGFVPLLAGMKGASAAIIGQIDDAWTAFPLLANPSERSWTMRDGDPLRSNGRALVHLSTPAIRVRESPDSTAYAGQEARFEVVIRNPADRPIEDTALALQGRSGVSIAIPFGTIGPRDSSAVQFRAAVPLVSDSAETFIWQVTERGVPFIAGKNSLWRLSRNIPWTFVDQLIPEERVDQLEMQGGLITRLADGWMTTTDFKGEERFDLGAESDAFAWRPDGLYHMKRGSLFRADPNTGDRSLVAVASSPASHSFLVLDSFYVFLDSTCATGGAADVVERSSGARSALAFPPSGEMRGMRNSVFAITEERGEGSLVEWTLPNGQRSEWTSKGKDCRHFAIANSGIVVACRDTRGLRIEGSPSSGSDFRPIAFTTSNVLFAMSLGDSHVVWHGSASGGSRIEAARFDGGGAYRLSNLETMSQTPIALTSRRLAFATGDRGVIRTGDLALPDPSSAYDESGRIFRWQTPLTGGTAIILSWEASGLNPEDRFLVWKSSASGRQELGVVRPSSDKTMQFVDSSLPAHHAGIERRYGVVWFRGLTAIDSLPAKSVDVPSTIDQLNFVALGTNPARSELAFSVRIPSTTPDSFRLDLYDVRGRRVATHALSGTSGEERILIDSGRSGRALASGIYFAQLVGRKGVVASRRVVLLR